MSSNLPETTPQPSADKLKAPGEPLHSLTPEQVRVGTKQIMTYAERQAFWRNSDVGKQLGFEQWGKQSKSEKNFVSNLSTEKWLGNKNQDNLIKEPNWNQAINSRLYRSRITRGFRTI